MSTCLLALFSAEYCCEININFYIPIKVIYFLDSLKKSSKKNETEIEKKIFDVLQQANDRRKKTGK